MCQPRKIVLFYLKLFSGLQDDLMAVTYREKSVIHLDVLLHSLNVRVHSMVGCRNNLLPKDGLPRTLFEQ